MPRFFKVVGHRGMPSRYPENTLPSFRAAIEAGVDAIEFDVHPTRDGRLVVTHDDTLERCSNGTGPVRDRTFEELRILDFGSWKESKFAGTQIPSLEEVIDLACGMSGTVELLIELKEDDPACALAVLEEITKRELLHRVVVLSFYANLLKLLHEREPRLRVQGFPIETFARSEPDAYEWLFRLCLWRDGITREKIDFFHARGIEVDVCPVDSREELEAIRNLEVDTVTTNAADVLMPLLQDLELRPAPLPRTFAAWRLHGKGMEQLICEELLLPEPGPEEMLVRIDAVGLCFSDIKIIRAGGDHPKLYGRDLAASPLTPGHEAVMTIVKTGDAVPLHYAPGQRFLIQCDIYVNSRSCAYGYAMDGAYAQYGLIDARVWRGEGRSYLLDFPERLSCVATALIEPWSCVRGSYGIRHRDTPMPGGRTLIGSGKGESGSLRAGELFRTFAPGEIAAFGLSAEEIRRILPGVKAENVKAGASQIADLKAPELRGISNMDSYFQHRLDYAAVDGKEIAVLRIGKGSAVIVGVAPWMLDYNKFFRLRSSFRRRAFLMSQILRNAGIASESVLLERFASEAQKEPWKNSYYLQDPISGDDPYRYYHW